MRKESSVVCDIGEEIRCNFWMNGSLPPSLVLTLRKLQGFLSIDAIQLKIKEDEVATQLSKLSSAQPLEKTFVSEDVQTDPIKELDLNTKVIFLMNL